jgi:two-component system cell cycle response regulator
MGEEPTHPPRILVVDDDRLLRALLTDALSKSGYEVSEAVDGEAALETVKRLRPDCIILDILMPGLDGYWVCRALKADSETALIPVLLLTTLSRKEDLLQGLGAGAEDFIRKPFDQQELLARVEAQLRVKQRHDALAKERNDLQALLEVSRAVSSTLRSRDIFQIIVRETAGIIASVRCSLVLIADDPLYGYVLASHDNAAVDRLKIELAKYPEMQEAIRTKEPVLIDDVHTHPLLAPVREQVGRLPLTSIYVLPVILRNQVIGTLFLRTAKALHLHSPRELKLCQVIADLAATALQNAHTYESLELNVAHLEQLTLLDDLTGLPNRRFLRKRLEEEFTRAQRHRTPLACVLYDLDNFKQVNDHWGHARGDEVLQQVAQLLQANVRGSDVVARYGGEEFVVLLPMTDESGALAEARRICQVIRKHRMAGAAREIRLSASAGVGIFPGPEIRTAEDLLYQADRALYRAKDSGKGDAALATPTASS